MITYLNSNLFFSPAKVLVNTVNTQGVMGKGIAKEFKKHFPDMFNIYRSFCEKKQFGIGMLWIYHTPNKSVLNFPTKSTWRKPSKIEYIEEGLKKFVATYRERGIESIAFPPLGCGNGELDWENQVQPLMEKYLGILPIDVYIHLYNPVRDGDFPEHTHIDNVSEWLRSEPSSMPFSEVIIDLKRKVGFEANLSKYDISFNDEEKELSLLISGQVVTWYHADLISVWAILRNHGVLSRHNIPNVFAADFDIIVEIFSSLEYISKVMSKRKFDKIEANSNVSLQLLLSSETHPIDEVDVG